MGVASEVRGRADGLGLYPKEIGLKVNFGRVLRGEGTGCFLREFSGTSVSFSACKLLLFSLVSFLMVPVGGECTRAAKLVRSRELRAAFEKKILEGEGDIDRREAIEGRLEPPFSFAASLGPLSSLRVRRIFI